MSWLNDFQKSRHERQEHKEIRDKLKSDEFELI
jgi:hypothetical protein